VEGVEVLNIKSEDVPVTAVEVEIFFVGEVLNPDSPGQLEDARAVGSGVGLAKAKVVQPVPKSVEKFEITSCLCPRQHRQSGQPGFPVGGDANDYTHNFLLFMNSQDDRLRLETSQAGERIAVVSVRKASAVALGHALKVLWQKINYFYH